MRNILILFSIFLVAQYSTAQYQIGLVPRVSPDKSVTQKVGYTDVKVSYGSPAVKQRKVWGNLVPYNKVWRAGANNATTIEFSSDVKINGLQLDSGKYAFFVIPKVDSAWTIIFNKISKQWGAFRYKEAEDALRTDVSPRESLSHTENLNYSIDQDGYQKGSIILSWANVEVEVPFTTNYLEEFKAEVVDRANKQPENIRWVVYLQGAEHLAQINSNLETANGWLVEAEKIMDETETSEWYEGFYPRDYIKGHLYWTKAKLLARDANFDAATEYVEKLQNLKNPTFYEKENESEGIDVSLKEWEKNKPSRK